MGSSEYLFPKNQWHWEDISIQVSANLPCFWYTKGRLVNVFCLAIFFLLSLKKRISSLNNGRIYVGETYSEDGDGPLSKRIHISDSGQSDSIHRIDFKQDEFNSNATFCRAISETISRKFCNVRNSLASSS